MTGFYDMVLGHVNGLFLDEPFAYESELEERLSSHMHKNGIRTRTQRSDRNRRYDVLCMDENHTICIELKVRAGLSCTMQFDSYHTRFPAGFIILCWIATRPLREIFDSIKEQSPTPIDLVELSKKHSMI